jgi:uncharacterized protein
MKSILALLLSLIFLSAGSKSAAGAATPSFDCGEATSRTEKLVCSNDELAALDREMANAFSNAKRLASVDVQTLKADQRLWIQARNESCRPPYVPADAAASCMTEVYRTRIAFLADPKYCSLGALANCPDVNRLPRRELDDALLHFLSHEAIGSVIGQPRAGAAEEISGNLTGPPDNARILGDGSRLYTACRVHSCTQKAAIVFAPDGAIVAAGALEMQCPELSCVNRQVLTIFVRSEADRETAGKAIQAWASEAVTESYAFPGADKPTLGEG